MRTVQSVIQLDEQINFKADYFVIRIDANLTKIIGTSVHESPQNTYQHILSLQDNCVQFIRPSDGLPVERERIHYSFAFYVGRRGC